jgi:hypothetical protein
LVEECQRNKCNLGRQNIRWVCEYESGKSCSSNLKANDQRNSKHRYLQKTVMTCWACQKCCWERRLSWSTPIPCCGVRWLHPPSALRRRTTWSLSCRSTPRWHIWFARLWWTFAWAKNWNQ